MAHTTAGTTASTTGSATNVKKVYECIVCHKKYEPADYLIHLQEEQLAQAISIAATLEELREATMDMNSYIRDYSGEEVPKDTPANVEVAENSESESEGENTEQHEVVEPLTPENFLGMVGGNSSQETKSDSVFTKPPDTGNKINIDQEYLELLGLLDSDKPAESKPESGAK